MHKTSKLPLKLGFKNYTYLVGNGRLLNSNFAQSRLKVKTNIGTPIPARQGKKASDKTMEAKIQDYCSNKVKALCMDMQSTTKDASSLLRDKATIVKQVSNARTSSHG